MSIKIEIGSAANIAALSKQIPEFEQSTTLERLQSRLDGVVGLILVAKYEGKLVGYKVGYQLTEDTFYSWLGGVIPEYRKQGVATLLLNYQEEWARNLGYKQIKVKSMNRFPGMLIMLISNGYKIVGIDKSACGSEDKIVFVKKLAVQGQLTP
ncbi:GNAT family N-acetyltransferase [Arsukibacterium indicum]|uniref:GNAT family N-acetyltransferase n=1 Tax=Arsukibacterium indicum TaxID=2848612 RepID=A0ABS6MM70_9GAMM|nr:GNAT family N-acetyltransferase [Arsukibacterium indicum]MBV2129675.1 GNAT family N-acetyltransferase [Arsukibacterium indicum]